MLGGSIAPVVGTVLLVRTGTAASVGTYAALVAIPGRSQAFCSRGRRAKSYFEEQGREAEELLARTETLAFVTRGSSLELASV
jgi:hypothetical protein